MTGFLSAAAALIAVTLLLLSIPFRRNRAGSDKGDDADTIQAANIDIARQRHAELEQRRETLGEQEYQRRLEELEVALIDDIHVEQSPQTSPQDNSPIRAWPLVAGIVVIVVSAGMYQITGSPGAIGLKAPDQHAGSAQPGSNQQLPPLSEMVALLEQKLLESPGNADGWALLGRTYMTLDRFTDAERAYKKLNQLAGDDADVLTAWADASLMAAGQKFSPPIVERLQRALQLDPDHFNALWLSAMAAQANEQPEQAILYWQRLLPLSKDNEAVSAQIRSLIVRAGGQLPSSDKMSDQQTESASVAANDSTTDMTSESAAKSGIIVQVAIAPELRDQVGDEDTVFVFAKAASGPPMPLAASRHRVTDLPLTLTLDDSMAMTPQFKLSGFDQVVVAARISKQGGPIAKAGDLESASINVAQPYRKMIQLSIDQVRQ